PGAAVRSIAFPVGGEGGMGGRLGSAGRLASQGIRPLPTAEGVQHFRRLWLGPVATRQVIVTSRLGMLDTWRPQTASTPGAPMPFLEQVRSLQPGVELVARTRLHLTQDPYLADHDYKGSLLFPTVFGLAAMAQAAVVVSGLGQALPARITDLRLERPIVVDPENGTTIEVHAQVVEEAAPATVRVGIRTEQTGFIRDHFAAV